MLVESCRPFWREREVLWKHQSANTRYARQGCLRCRGTPYRDPGNKQRHTSSRQSGHSSQDRRRRDTESVLVLNHDSNIVIARYLASLLLLAATCFVPGCLSIAPKLHLNLGRLSAAYVGTALASVDLVPHLLRQSQGRRNGSTNRKLPSGVAGSRCGH